MQIVGDLDVAVTQRTCPVVSMRPVLPAAFDR